MQFAFLKEYIQRPAFIVSFNIKDFKAPYFGKPRLYLTAWIFIMAECDIK